MIVNPILIVGAPRSGTSLLQKILRNHPESWSLPSEADIIWDRYCHPALRNWESESMTEAELMPETKRQLLILFEKFMCPASFWKPVEKTDLIWGFRRMPVVRRILRAIYLSSFPLLTTFSSRKRPKRLVEKTTSNCFRLGYVNAVFPDAKIIYPTRDGRNNVSSLINCWLHPTRFFTYDVPEQLRIEGYPYERWKFVLPPGWRDYVSRSLEEVCAFQWRACHEAMLAETAKRKYRGRILRLKLEELSAAPDRWLRTLAEFLELPYDDYFRSVAADFPIVNSPDNDTSREKWRHQNKRSIERITPMIEGMLGRLGYQL